MSRREDIDNAIWDDPEFAALSPNATLLYLWSWTNPRCGMAGLYKVRLASMTDSKVPADAVPAALAELAEAGFAFYEDHVLWVRSRVKYLRSRSETMAVSIARDVEKLSASHPLRVRFLAKYGDDAWLRGPLAKGTHRGPIEDPSEKPLGKGNSHAPPRTPRGVPRQGQGEGQGLTRDDKAEELPEDFPRELEPHLEAVHKILSSLGARHQSKAVSRLSLASVLMGRPRKPLVRAAHDCAAYWDGRSARLKDAVAAYRNWLDKTDDLAGTEQLSGNAAVVPMGSPRRKTDAWADWYDRRDAGEAS